MRSMIYYPGFEVQKDEWLKFALLYFEELRPIIPYMSVSDDKYLSTSAIHVILKKGKKFWIALLKNN